MTVTASPVPILKDNYAWLLRESSTGATAIVDPADAEPIIEAIEKAGGRLDLLLITHHHADHIPGVDCGRARCKCPFAGPRQTSIGCRSSMRRSARATPSGWG